MISKTVKMILIISLFLNVSSQIAAATAEDGAVKVGILTASPIQKKVFIKHVNAFMEQHPEISVELIFKADADYKTSFAKWISEKTGPDILYWQGGGRLSRVIQSDDAHDLTQFYQKHALGDQFNPSVLEAVSNEASRYYAVPISYYQWGFYYRESVFERLKLSPPSTLAELINVGNRLKENNIVPFALGNKNHWPVAAWFDYLNLRINGLAYHQALLKGEASFTDPKTIEVFTTWKYFIDEGFFLSSSEEWTWSQAVPFLYHEKAGMTLIGNFFAGNMPIVLKDDFRFFPFPVIDPSMPNYEEAPLDLFLVPRYVSLNPQIEKVLLMFAEKAFQEEFNASSGMISPNKNVMENSDYFIRNGRKLLSQADGVSQFFDRDTNEKMASLALPILSEFVRDGDVDKVSKQLESARRISFEQ